MQEPPKITQPPHRTSKFAILSLACACFFWIIPLYLAAIGGIYEVCFDLAGFVTTGSPSNPKRVEVSVSTNTTTLSLAVPTVRGSLPFALAWSRHCFEFVASSSSSRLSFRSLVPSDASGLLLDNVSVESSSPHMSIRISEVEVFWTARTNRKYQVQYRTDLTTNTWANLGVAIPGSITNSIYDRVVVGQPKRFYRVTQSRD